MKKVIFTLMIIFAFTMVMVPQAIAGGPAAHWSATDFITYGLDANGDWKAMDCTFAKLTLLDDTATETYKCKFDPEGDAVIPAKAMTWNYENSFDGGPWRWYSDVLEINSVLPPGCYMYTHAAGGSPEGSSWSLTITPSGAANATVKYRPPVFEGTCD